MFNKPSKTKQPDSPEHAYDYALFLLGLSMRTEFEMRRKMQLRGYNSDVIEQTVIKLYDEKLLDDIHYAEVYLNNLKEYRTLGYYGVKKKLTEKQLPQETIEELMEKELPVREELKIARKLMIKELGDHKKSALKQEDKQKLARKLQVRGFRMDVVTKLLF